jgi:hypothetical protein
MNSVRRFMHKLDGHGALATLTLPLIREIQSDPA